MRISTLQETILNSINEGVFTVDRNWRITAFNRAAEKITGVSAGDAVGRPCREVFKANICENACALKQTIDSGEPVVNRMIHILNVNGETVPIRISTALLKDEEGKMVGGVETFQDLTLVEQLRKALESRYTFEDIIGRSEPMTDLFQLIPQIAESDSTVLIEGDSGTGKELAARAVHNLSPRSRNRFVAINCAALPDTLLESELFGYKAGAFTDARKDKPGRLALADGGTVFLDEIGDISPALQVRLLRVLQERCIEPLGGVESVKINVRVVAATNKDLVRKVQEGTFREDLFYRIRIIHLKMPRLKDRRVDIPLLTDHMIHKFNRLQGKDIAGVSDGVMTRLMEYDYPGNVRELENIIEHAFVLCKGDVIETEHLPPELRPETEIPEQTVPSPVSIQAMENIIITDALRRHRGNRKRAAEELGIHPTTLYRKMKSLKIQPPGKDGRAGKN